MATQYCARCGSILERGAKFCTECGAKVDEPAKPVPAAEPAHNELSYSHYNNAASSEPSPADTWAKADVFDDVPKAPDIPAADLTSDSPAENWQTNSGGFQQMSSPAPGTSSKKNTILILGIVTVICSVSFPLAAYICGIIGLVQASKAKKAGDDVRNGRLLCIIGLVLAVLNSIVGMVIGVVAAMSEAFTDLFSVFVSY